MKKLRTFGIAALVLVWALLSLNLWFGPKEDYTTAERRPLAQLPQVTGQAIFSGKFAENFEDFTLDQFPLRDSFRRVKSLFHYYVLNQADNNGIYLVGDTVAKLEYPLNLSSVKYATGRLQYVYDSYLADTDCRIYASMIPDKGYFLAESNGYPALDYKQMEKQYREALPWAQYLDIKSQLTGQDYYRTDTHWRQEKITSVARFLCDALGVQTGIYREETLEKPFYGVYFGQAALPLEPEELVILENPVLANCTVTDPITGKVTAVYDMEKLDTPDLYEVFLSGAQPILTIDNPAGDTGRELVIFRDSYGSSLAPLLLQSYSKVTMVDIRYIHPDQIGDYVTFKSQDVLFLYSTLILNSGRSLK